MGKRGNRKTTTSGHEPREFKVLIYESEYRQIQAWASKFQHLETGGDLFGLWSEEPHTVVIQLVLGPGQRCRRSGTSFYQDVSYLERVGNHLTGNEGLCHIGEWHSHHTLGLTRPSGGDENTVWSNMPRYGIKRFVLFIATISNGRYHYHHNCTSSRPPGVNVGCFLFEYDAKTRQELRVIEGSFDLIRDGVAPNPFRSKAARLMRVEAESVNSESELKGFETTPRDNEDVAWDTQQQASGKEFHDDKFGKEFDDDDDNHDGNVDDDDEFGKVSDTRAGNVGIETGPSNPDSEAGQDAGTDIAKEADYEDKESQTLKSGVKTDKGSHSLAGEELSEKAEGNTDKVHEAGQDAETDVKEAKNKDNTEIVMSGVKTASSSYSACGEELSEKAVGMSDSENVDEAAQDEGSVENKRKKTETSRPQTAEIEMETASSSHPVSGEGFPEKTKEKKKNKVDEIGQDEGSVEQGAEDKNTKNESSGPQTLIVEEETDEKFI